MLLLASMLHIALSRTPATQLQGDERLYRRVALTEAYSGPRGILPGEQEFDHRPMLITRLYANALVRDPAKPPAYQDILAGVFWFKLTNLLTLAVLIYVATLIVSGGQVGGVIAAGLILFFPWLGFYVHALWPELMHAVLLTAGVLAIVAYLRFKQWVWLIPGGVSWGYALLLKGVLNSFLPVAILFILITALVRSKGFWASRIGRSLLVTLAFAGPLYGTILPQWLTNAKAGYGYNISANRWRNIEWGVRMPVPGDPAPISAYTWDNAKQDYFSVEGLQEREAAAQQRTMKFIHEIGYVKFITRQVRKFFALILSEPSFFETALGEWHRWGDQPPTLAKLVVWPGRMMWYGLWLFALIGIVVRIRNNLSVTFLGIFFLYYVAALHAIPVKVRFAMQLVPVLAILSGIAVAWLFSGPMLNRRKSSNPVEEAAKTVE